MAQFLSIPVANIADSGTASETQVGKLVDDGQNFLTTVAIGDVVHNTTDNTYATVTTVTNDTTLVLSADIMADTETFVIYSATSYTTQLISARNISIVEQLSVNAVTVLYSLGTGAADLITITHATQATGYAMRDAIQNALVQAYVVKNAPDVVIPVSVTKTVIGIGIA